MMNYSKTCCTVAAVVAWQLSLTSVSVAAGGEQTHKIEFVRKENQVAVMINGSQIAAYIYRDPKIPRPFFANLKTPGGSPVTRNHPPVAGVDAVDHDTFHPGLWLTFGDISGADFWRNQDRVHQEEITLDGPGKFSVRNRFETADGKTICNEVCHFCFHTFDDQSDSYLLLWDSTYSNPQHEFAFGDQEEMGLGIRVATPLAVSVGGVIEDAAGRRNEKQVWGNSASWCDYRGNISDRQVGVTLIDHSSNFRPSWYHARDYGVLLANPFGRHSYNKGDVSKVVVKPGESIRLRYGIFVYSTPQDASPNLAEVCKDYQRLSLGNP